MAPAASDENLYLDKSDRRCTGCLHGPVIQHACKAHEGEQWCECPCSTGEMSWRKNGPVPEQRSE